MKVIEKAIRRGGPERRARPGLTVRLGDTLGELMEDKITPRQGRFESVVRIWGEVLPAELSRHCRIVDISAGNLKVVVDSPSYMYELQLCSSGVLKELQRQCPAARLGKIRLALG